MGGSSRGELGVARDSAKAEAGAEAEAEAAEAAKAATTHAGNAGENLMLTGKDTGACSTRTGHTAHTAQDTSLRGTGSAHTAQGHGLAWLTGSRSTRIRACVAHGLTQHRTQACVARGLTQHWTRACVTRGLTQHKACVAQAWLTQHKDRTHGSHSTRSRACVAQGLMQHRGAQTTQRVQSCKPITRWRKHTWRDGRGSRRRRRHVHFLGRHGMDRCERTIACENLMRLTTRHGLG